MELHLQQADVLVDALHGQTAEEFVAVCDGGALLFAYLRASGTWYRFYLDVGVLFLDEDSAPDRDDDLGEGQAYTDLLEMLGGPAQIERFRMCDGTLEVRLSRGRTLTIFGHGYAIGP